MSQVALLTSAQTIRQELVQSMSEKELKLYSAEVQEKFDKSSNLSMKSDFTQSRIDYSTELANLQNAILKDIATKLEELELQLQNALDNLNSQLQSLANQVAILDAIKSVTNLVAQIISAI